MKEFTTIEEAKNDLLSCATYLASDINSNEGQAAAIKTIVLQYLENGDVDNAAQFADVVKDSYVRNQLLIAVITKCVAIDDDEYAFQLVESIDEIGKQVTAREAIAMQKASKGDLNEALEIAETLEHSSDALAEIAINQAKKGFEDEALETIKRIEFFKSKVEALIEIAIYYLKQEQDEKAIKLLEQALNETEEIEFIEDKIRALLEIGNYFIEAKRNDQANESFAKTSAEIEKLDGIHKDNLFVNVAIGYLKAESIDLADSTLDEVLDKTQIANCLVGFSQVFEKEDDTEEALDTLEEAYAILMSQHDKEIRDSKARYQLFGAISTQFAKLGKIERAMEIAHENPVESQKNFALTNIAQICILQGNDEMAEQALKGIQTDSQKLSALVALSDAKNQIEKEDEAIEFLDKATTLVETIPQFIARSETQNELAKRYAFYGKTEKSRELASESLQTIAEILGNENRSFALTELSNIYNKYDFEFSDDDKEILETLVRKTTW